MNGPLARGVGVSLQGLRRVVVLTGLVVGCGSDGGVAPPEADGGTAPTRCETDFARLPAVGHVGLRDDVMPIFGLSCTVSSCHSGDTPAAKLYLGVRCVYDPGSPHHCTFADTPSETTSAPGVMPLTPGVVERVYEGLLAASNTAPGVRRVTPGDPDASFLVDKVGGTHDDRGYDCVSLGPAGVGGPCGSAMPFGSSGLCDPGGFGPSDFNTIASWVLQGAHDD